MILISSFPKTGVHWLKFVVCNYINIKMYGAEFSFTYQEIEDIFKFPVSLHHTHLPLSGRKMFGMIKSVPEYYSKFDKIIYFERNPLDTMISFWYYLKNRDPPFNIIRNQANIDLIDQFSTLEGFVEYFLPLYIDHIKSTRHKADIVLNYDKLREDPSDFKKAIKMILNEEIDEEIFKKAIEISSFKNIRDMGIRTGQKHGLAKGYKGHFCRDGRTGQYKEVMSKKLIKYIQTECDKHFKD